MVKKTKKMKISEKMKMNKKHPTYKKMILKTINYLNVDQDRKAVFSYSLIKNSLLDFWGLNNNNRSKKYLRQAFSDLELNFGFLIKIRSSFRLSTLYFKGKKRRISRLVKRKTKQKKNSETKNRSIEELENLRPKAKTITDNKVKSNKKVSNPFATNLHYNTVYADTLSNEPKTKAVWQYYDSNKVTNNRRADGWYDYEKKANDIVEVEWQKYIKNRAMNDVRAVKSGEFEYFVDFMSWQQTNIVHHAHTKRKIRRLDENGKITVNPYEMSL
jgi:hypothetical protein